MAGAWQRHVYAVYYNFFFILFVWSGVYTICGER